MNSIFFTLLSAKNNIESLNYFIETLLKIYLELRPEKESIESIRLINREKLVKERRKEDTCCQFEIYFPFMERFKGRVFPWYLPIWEFKEKNKKNSLI